MENKRDIKVIYATDIDRTLIFSERFLKEYKPSTNIELVETINGKPFSYISTEVKKELQELSRNPNVAIVPITTRTKEQFDRIHLGIDFPYVATLCGGQLFENNSLDADYNRYVINSINQVEAMTIMMDLEDELGSSITRKLEFLGNKYIFFKTNKTEHFDIYVENIMNKKYPNWKATRQESKCYIIPKAISKQVVLRWLWNKLGEPYIIASGDSELDLPMLSLANKALIPKHGRLLTQGYVLESNTVESGVTGPLETIQTVNNYINSLSNK